MKYTPVVPWYPHQKEALKFLLKHGGGGLQVPMRWGKTKVAIDFVNCTHLMEGTKRVLVICPLSAVGVWEDEIERHTPDGLEIEWQIVNFEQTYSRYYHSGRRWLPIPNKELEAWRAEIVIVDESHRIGNPTAEQSKATFRLGSFAKHRVFMTGTMFHRKPFYVFGQARFYDPSIFGSSFNAFKHRIAIFGGHGGYEVLRYVNLKWMMDRLKPHVFIQKYVPKRPPVINKLTFRLTGTNLKYYKEMEKESIIRVGEEFVISPIVLSRHLRLQQIAGGWVKTPSGKYRRVGRDQIRVAQDRFKEYSEQGIEKFVVACRFLPELRDVALAARAEGYRPILFHGGVGGAERKRRWTDFQQTGDRVAFVSQIATGSMSINLSAADTIMFYSLSESYVDHDQFSRRIELYDESRTLQYDFLIPRGTRTEVTFEALQKKQDVAKFLASDPELVERITSKLKEDD